MPEPDVLMQLEIKTLGSLAAQEVALWWGLKDQLWKLNGTVTRIKAVIQDAEEQAQKQKQNHQIEDWLKKLREAVYDAEDLLDDFSTQVLRKQLMPGKRVSWEVRVFFSRSNQFVYGLRMGHRVKALRRRLDERIRKEIVERCGGVPLVIKAIARLMSLKERARWLSFERVDSFDNAGFLRVFLYGNNGKQWCPEEGEGHTSHKYSQAREFKTSQPFIRLKQQG
jgi:hypothetical protein